MKTLGGQSAQQEDLQPLPQNKGMPCYPKEPGSAGAASCVCGSGSFRLYTRLSCLLPSIWLCCSCPCAVYELSAGKHWCDIFFLNLIPIQALREWEKFFFKKKHHAVKPKQIPLNSEMPCHYFMINHMASPGTVDDTNAGINSVWAVPWHQHQHFTVISLPFQHPWKALLGRGTWSAAFLMHIQSHFCMLCLHRAGTTWHNYCAT